MVEKVDAVATVDDDDDKFLLFTAASYWTYRLSSDPIIASMPEIRFILDFMGDEAATESSQMAKSSSFRNASRGLAAVREDSSSWNNGD